MRQSAQGLPWLAADGLRPDRKAHRCGVLPVAVELMGRGWRCWRWAVVTGDAPRRQRPGR